MNKYFTTELVNGKQIVDAVIFSRDKEDGYVEVPKEYEQLNIIGLIWNGTSFEEVPREEVEVEKEPTLKEIYEAIKATEATNDEILYNMLFASNEDVDK